MVKQSKLAAAAGLLGLAAAWPGLYGVTAQALLSPAEQLLRSSYCGTASHDAAAWLGHCAACWAGSSMIALAAALVLYAPTRSLSPQRR
jgi:hypothetical protein